MLSFSKHAGQFLVISFLSFMIAACQVTEPSNTITATPGILAEATTNSPPNTPTRTAIPARETATNVSPTTTPIHLPSPATPPTNLPTPTAVPPTPTQLPIETESPVKIFQERESLSPDGKWRAHTLLTFVEESGYVEGYQTDLTVNMLEGDISWLAYSTLQGAGMGYDVPNVVLWSNDGRSLFFTLRATPDGCSGFVGQFNSGLYQLDLASGEVNRLEVSGAISPDGTTIAYLVWEPVAAVQLYDLASQTTTTIAWEVALERRNTALNLVWSSDSQAIALEYAASFCLEGGYSLIHSSGSSYRRTNDASLARASSLVYCRVAQRQRDLSARVHERRAEMVG